MFPREVSCLDIMGLAWKLPGPKYGPHRLHCYTSDPSPPMARQGSLPPQYSLLLKCSTCWSRILPVTCGHLHPFFHWAHPQDVFIFRFPPFSLLLAFSLNANGVLVCASSTLAMGFICRVWSQPSLCSS